MRVSADKSEAFPFYSNEFLFRLIEDVEQRPF